MKHNIHNYIAKTAIDYARITPEEVIDISGEVFGFSSEPAPLTGLDCAEDSAGMTMTELAALFLFIFAYAHHGRAFLRCPYC